jgi:hypothetical protein
MLAHGFRAYNPWLFGPVALGLWCHSSSWWEGVVEEAAHPMLTGKQRKEEEGSGLFKCLIFFF